MSFILDALRKSEHARQRQTGPGLAEVPVAPPKSKTHLWATVAIVLLVVNLGAVGVLLLRRAQHGGEAPEAQQARQIQQAPDAASPTLAQAPAITQSAAAPAPRPVVSERAVSAPVGRNLLADEIGGVDPTLQSAAAAVPAGPPAVVKNSGTKRGSVVYAPVPEAGDVPYSAPPVEPAARPAAVAAAPARESLPGADEMTARGGLPALHLDLHVYAAQPQQRFIFVNSRKYGEGATLAEGPVVEQITADGAVLNFRGTRFRLSNN